jgi:L-lactate dehydrogenase complex protein LldG
MEESTSREKVLKKIRNALISKSSSPFTDIDFESSVYNEFTDSLDIVFAEEFSKVQGQFVYCENEDDLISNLSILFSQKNWFNIFCLEEKIQGFLNEAKISYSSLEEELLDMNVSVTFCEFLVARLGSIMVSSRQISGRRLNIYPPVHIVIAYTSQLVPDIKHALAAIKMKYSERFPSLVSLITGPSRTADIEKTLVMGAHGPKELFVFLIDDIVVEEN